MKIKIEWHRAAVGLTVSADVKLGERTHRLVVRRSASRARTFHGAINGVGVGVWSTLELAKTGTVAIFERSPSYGQDRRRQLSGARRLADRVAQQLLTEGADKLDEQRQTVQQIQAALSTTETGTGLVKLVRDARAAELALTALSRLDVTPQEDEEFEVLERRMAAARRVS